MARALIACGVGKDSRVGILMTNRPEWIAGVFGTALAGGVAVALSTFSTPPELEHLLRDVRRLGPAVRRHACSRRTSREMLGELEPAIAGRAGPAAIDRVSVPAPSRRGRDRRAQAVRSSLVRVPRPRRGSRRATLVEARAGTVKPATRRSCSSPRDRRASPRASSRAARRRDPALALAAHLRARGRCPRLDGQRLLLVGQLHHGDRRHASRPAARSCCSRPSSRTRRWS